MKVTDIRRVAVIGAGTMGHGIGQEFALAGYDVVFHDQSSESLGTVKERIRRDLLDLIGWGLAEQSQVEPTLGRIQTTQDLEEAGAGSDFVIEAVFENLEVKQEVLRRLDAACPEHTILASNTSSLMPSTLAEATGRPDRVLVAHYFYPPPLMPLVEIVRGEATSDEVAETVYELMKAIGKRPVIAQKEALGFIVNRLQMALVREALNIVERGIASAEDVDLCVWNSFGRRLAVVGPIQLLEHQDGWDQALAIDQYIVPDLSNRVEPSPLVLEKLRQGKLGSKSGEGFYRWDPEAIESFNGRLGEALAGSLRAERERGSGRYGD